MNFTMLIGRGCSTHRGGRVPMTRILDSIFVRGRHVCPWWLCFTFDNYFRRFLHDPERILGPYVQEGHTVLDIGPGMGYFTIPMARMVGETGRVIAADIQKEMLSALSRRAKRAGVDMRILLHQSTRQSLGLDSKVDFTLAFWMLHEVPDRHRFLSEIHGTLQPGGLFLLAEPTIHVPKAHYMETIQIGYEAGFVLKANPHIALSRSALLIRT